MYYTKDIKVKLVEWKNRLYTVALSDFGYEFKYFSEKIDKMPILKQMLDEAISTYDIDKEGVKKWYYGSRHDRDEYKNRIHKTAILIHFWNYILSDWKISEFIDYFKESSDEERKKIVIETYISPVVDYLIDKLDESNSITFLITESSSGSITPSSLPISAIERTSA